MSKPALKTSPRPVCVEAEAASSRALQAVREIFGDPELDQFDDDEPTMIRHLRNGGRARLRRALRQRGFQDTKLEGAESA